MLLTGGYGEREGYIDECWASSNRSFINIWDAVTRLPATERFTGMWAIRLYVRVQVGRPWGHPWGRRCSRRRGALEGVGDGRAGGVRIVGCAILNCSFTFVATAIFTAAPKLITE